MRFTKTVVAMLSSLLTFAPCMSVAEDFDSWWAGFKEKSSIALNGVSAWCADHEDEASSAWDNTKTWCIDHKKEIAVAAVAVAVLAVVVIANKDSGSSVTSGQSLYSNIPDTPSVGTGKEFTQAQKLAIIEENMRRNGGQLRSDLSGAILSAPQRYALGYIPPKNEAQVDHVFPRSRGGENSYNNARVLSREENLLKSNRIE